MGIIIIIISLKNIDENTIIYLEIDKKLLVLILCIYIFIDLNKFILNVVSSMSYAQGL